MVQWVKDLMLSLQQLGLLLRLELISSLVQWVKDLALWQLWHRSQLRLRSDQWPRNSICHRVAKKEKTKKKTLRYYFFIRLSLPIMFM